MKPASKPVFWTFLSVLLAAFPALAAGPGRRHDRQAPQGAVTRPAVRAPYVADRDGHGRGQRREEAREHRGDRDDRWRMERRQGNYRGDRDDYYRYRPYQNGRGNSYGYSYRDPYRYGNAYPDGYGSYGTNSSYDRGYRDGVTRGRSDYALGYGYNPRRYDRRGDLEYRMGFDAGYNAAYGRF